MACLWFFNFIVTKFLEEKGEWNATLEKMLDRYDARVIDNTTALVRASEQDHALRGKIQEFMNNVDNQLRAIDNRSRGGGND